MIPAVEQLESRDCPSSPADLWVQRYRGLSDAELRQRAWDAQQRASALVVDANQTQTHTGVHRFYDLLRAPDRVLRLRNVRAEMQALTQIAQQRGR